MVFKQKHICRKIFLSKITSYTKKCVGAVFSMHRFSSFWTFWKPFDPIQHLRGLTFWIFNFWQNWDTLTTTLKKCLLSIDLGYLLIFTFWEDIKANFILDGFKSIVQFCKINFILLRQGSNGSSLTKEILKTDNFYKLLIYFEKL